ncbi:tetratricopeptide repeat protein [Treponema sp.]|uniref:tetratricopeptide repeat protein n=1 Tax=Treponema sp. TaxID=166 RepID=UPI00388CFB97
MKNKRRKLSAFFCIFFIFLNSLSFAQEVTGTKIALPQRRVTEYFSDIDKDILLLVEKGSPESLKNAVTYLKRNRDAMKENEKILHYIAVSIMQMCWKSQGFSEVTFEQGIRNSYTEAILSSKNGIYDGFSSPQIFLDYVLPAMVLAVSDTRNDYYEQAEINLKKALELNKDSVFANYLLGLLYVRLGEYKLANDYFSIAYILCSDCFEVSFAYAESFIHLSQPEKSFEFAQKLLSLYPQNKNLLKLCAEASFAANDMQNAEIYVSRVLQIEPENSYFLLFRARILVKNGEYIRAASLLDAYARKDSLSRDYLILRYSVQKNWNKNISAATATIENAIKLYPDDMEIVLAAASLACETGVKIDDKDSEQLADIILQNESDNLEALQIKISAMVSGKKWTQAYKASSEFIKRQDVSRAALFTHIKICLSSGRKSEAYEMASKLYSESPSDEEVLQSYIDVLVSTGRTGEASKLINQLIQSSSSKMKSFLYYERSFLASGESAVLADLRSSLTANPRNKDSLFRLYQIYFNKKEYRKAQYYLKQVVALSPNDESLRVLNQNLDNLLKN